MSAIKTITISFNVPSDMDYPSEVLAAVKQLLLNAVEAQVGEGHCPSHTRGVLV